MRGVRARTIDVVKPPARTKQLAAAAALAVIAAAPAARADDWGGLYDGRTLQHGGEAFAEGGFPGAGLGVLFGTSDAVDVGVEVAATYSGLGVYATDAFSAAFGVDPRVVARFALARGKVLSVLLRLEPGVRFARIDPSVRWGPELVLGADFGIRITPRASIYAGVEIPVYLDIPNTTPANPFAVFLPILFGAGFEYHATDVVGFGGRVAPGVNVAAGDFSPSPRTGFALVAEGYFIFRWGAR